MSKQDTIVNLILEYVFSHAVFFSLKNEASYHFIMHFLLIVPYHFFHVQPSFALFYHQ